MHQVLGADVAARERAGVAAESRKLAEHVEGGRALKRHDPYTELEAELIRQGFKAHIVNHGQREAGWRWHGRKPARTTRRRTGRRTGASSSPCKGRERLAPDAGVTVSSQ